MVQLMYVRSRTAVGWLIRAAQWWFPASHAAIVTKDDTVIHATVEHGVVEEPVRQFLDRYVLVDVVDVEADYDKAISFARSVLGAKYDFGAIARMVSRLLGTGDARRWQCIELLETAIEAGGCRRFRIPLDRVTVRQSYQAA